MTGVSYSKIGAVDVHAAPEAIQQNWPLHETSSYRNSTPGSCYDDLKGIRENFEQSSQRLFNPGPDIDVEVCDIDVNGAHPTYIETEESLNEYIIKTNPKKENAGRLCTLHQDYSWGPVLLSAKAAQALFSHLDVFPDFLHILNAFGVKESGVDEAFSGFYPHLRIEGGERAIEFCFLLKHVEPNGSKNTRNPYSLRHFGVYQCFDFARNRNDSILIKPTEGIGRRLRDVLKSPEAANRFAGHWTHFPLLCLSAATEKWRTYINFMAERFNEIVDRVGFSTVETKADNQYDDQVKFKDLQLIVFWMDQLLLASHVLKMNIEVIDALEEFAEQAAEIEPDCAEKASRYKSFKHDLKKSRLSHKFYRNIVDVLYKRSEKVATILRDIVSLMDSNVMKELGKSTNDGGAVMLELSMLATREAKTMKALTVVALIFLPANFVATWLSMGYLSIKDMHHGFIQFRAKPEMWIFVIITVPLMVVTIGGWYLFDLRNKRGLLPGARNRIVCKDIP